MQPLKLSERKKGYEIIAILGFRFEEVRIRPRQP